MDINEEIQLRYILDNNEEDDSFHDNITTTASLPQRNGTEKLVRIVQTFFRFVTSIGYDIEDVMEVNEALFEAHLELQEEIEMEEEDE